MRSLLVAIVAAALCTVAAAQDRIYKVRLPDGRILFTDKPPPGAQIVSEREVEPAAAPPPPPPDKRGAAQPSLQERAARADARARERSAEVEKAFAAVQAAEKELADARQALETGRAPREGEFLGTARGGVRPGPAYQERIAGLEKAVIAAEQKLARSRADLDAVR
jgi:hypothetical protein